MYIKKTNIINFEIYEKSLKIVQCPYCHTFLKSVPKYVTAMICWQCKKEFRIEQDHTKFEKPQEGGFKRTKLNLDY